MSAGLRVSDITPLGERPADVIRGRTGITLAGVATMLGSPIVGSPSNGDVIVYDSATDTWVLVSTSTFGVPLTIQDEGVPLATAADTLNFVGAGVTATGAGGTKTITVSGTPNAELNYDGGQSVIKAHGAMGATETFDPLDGNVHTGTLDADCTFTLTNPTGSGACLLEIRITASGTHTWTWPGSVSWAGGTTPAAPTTGNTAIVMVESLDGGTSWFAIEVGVGGITGFAVPALAYGTPAAGAATTTIRSDATITPPTEAQVTFTNITTNNVSTSKHGYAPILPNDATKYLDGTGAWTAPPGSGSGGSDHEHVMDCLFSGDGSTTAWTLPAVPFDQYSVAAYVAGTLTEVTLSGTLFDIATFGSAPSSGTNNIRFDIVAAVV